MKKEKTIKEKKVVAPAKVKKEPKEIIPETYSEPRLVSYKMTAIIRTGEYQSVTPEILIEGGTLEEASAILTKEIDAIKLKYDPTIKRVVSAPIVNPVVPPTPPVRTTAPAPATALVSPPTKTVADTIPPGTPITVNGQPTGMVTPGAKEEVSKSEPFIAAEKVIVAAKSMDALEMIEGQVERSVKLTEDEKHVLLLMIIDIRKEMYAKNNPA